MITYTQPSYTLPSCGSYRQPELEGKKGRSPPAGLPYKFVFDSTSLPDGRRTGPAPQAIEFHFQEAGDWHPRFYPSDFRLVCIGTISYERQNPADTHLSEIPRSSHEYFADRCTHDPITRKWIINFPLTTPYPVGPDGESYFELYFRQPGGVGLDIPTFAGSTSCLEDEVEKPRLVVIPDRGLLSRLSFQLKANWQLLELLGLFLMLSTFKFWLWIDSLPYLSTMPHLFVFLFLDIVVLFVPYMSLIDRNLVFLLTGNETPAQQKETRFPRDALRLLFVIFSFFVCPPREIFCLHSFLVVYPVVTLGCIRNVRLIGNFIRSLLPSA